MEHTCLYNYWCDLNELEISELRDAIKAHGGRYAWPDGISSGPIVIYNIEHPIDIEINDIWLDRNDILFNGEDVVTGEEYQDCEIGDVEFSHVGFITEYISATDTVKTVTNPERLKEILNRRR